MNSQHICGQCNFFVRWEATPNGHCHFNPPTLFKDGTKGRLPVKEADLGCGQFKEIDSPPAVRTKTLIPTHGQIVKDAQKGKQKDK